MKVLFWGIDFGGTNVKLGIVDEDGNLVEHTSFTSDVSEGPDSLTKRIKKNCTSLMEEKNLDPVHFKAAGIGSPGPLDMKSGCIIDSPNLPGFEKFPLRNAVSEALGCPAILENDANVVCWGEYWRGAGRDVDDMILYTLGTGIGGGIVYAGELLRGSLGNGGELGHMIVHPGGRDCNCGQEGCLEAYASATHMVHRTMEALDLGRTSELSKFRQNHKLTAKEIFDSAESGDELANEIVNSACEALALATINMRHILEPQMAVLGGGVSKAGSILTERVEKYYNQHLWKLKDDPVIFKLAELGDDAGVVGAAGLAVYSYANGLLEKAYL